MVPDAPVTFAFLHEGPRVPRNFMTGLIQETPEVLNEYKGLLDRIPMQEPANGGPTDEQFSKDLDAFAKGILARKGKRIDPFPDPLLTSAQYRTKR